uniref:Uncharacterized protein n=1 Tax=Arundo donax TaxID=35708 RepID=A0A0A9BEL6_ARUDO
MCCYVATYYYINIMTYHSIMPSRLPVYT